MPQYDKSLSESEEEAEILKKWRELRQKRFGQLVLKVFEGKLAYADVTESIKYR